MQWQKQASTALGTRALEPSGPVAMLQLGWRNNSLHCEAISQSAAILSVMLNLRRDPCYGHIEISTFHVLFSCVLRGLVIP